MKIGDKLDGGVVVYIHPERRFATIRMPKGYCNTVDLRPKQSVQPYERRPWSAEEAALLSKHSLIEVSRITGRSYASVRNKRREMRKHESA